MIHAIRQDVVVLPGGRIEIVSPELTPGAHAQVIVLEEAPTAGKHLARNPHRTGRRASAPRKESDRMPGKPTKLDTKKPLRLVDRRAFMRLPLQERRRILAEQAERVADHYGRDAEVRDLGGGDFLEC